MARLHLIIGAMGGGKTERLVRMLELETDNGKSALAFRPALDTRVSDPVIRSRSGKEFPAILFHHVASIPQHLNSETALVAIDEAHMAPQGMVALCEALILEGIDVVVAGVPTDEYGAAFQPFHELLPRADRIDNFNRRCRIPGCKRVAIYTVRTVNNTARIVPGGDDAYQVVCRPCFHEANDHLGLVHSTGYFRNLIQGARA